MVGQPPLQPHLRQTVSLLNDYLSRAPSRPLFVAGDYGVGRGYAVDRVITDRQAIPLWRYEPGPAPTNDMEGNDLIPVYDLEKPTLDVTTPCFQLVASEFVPSGDFKGAEVVMFSPPPSYAIEDFLTERGYPKELARGNPTYAAAALAMRAWDAARVVVSSDTGRPTGWEAFRQGGDAPVEGRLFGYYAAENLPRDYWWWNTLLYLRREVPAWLFDRGLDEVRARWPEQTRFPSLLRAKKEMVTARPPAPTTIPLAPKPKEYSIDW